jgi:hypothetical protein
MSHGYIAFSGFSFTLMKVGSHFVRCEFSWVDKDSRTPVSKKMLIISMAEEYIINTANAIFIFCWSGHLGGIWGFSFSLYKFGYFITLLAEMLPYIQE